jgi:PST family polysaccharide transporter
LILVQAPRLLITPMLTAMGRPRDAMVGIGVEIAVMTGLVLTVGARSLPWALAVWALRELSAAPVMAVVLQRATGIGARTQLRGTVVPLVASLCMGAAVYALRPVVPASFPPAARLALLVPAGAAAFVAVAWLIGRSSLTALTAFVASARTRS